MEEIRVSSIKSTDFLFEINYRKTDISWIKIMSYKSLLTLYVFLFLPIACAPVDTIYRRPAMVTSMPEPINDNSGTYLSPYTKEGRVTVWVKKIINNELLIATSHNLDILVTMTTKGTGNILEEATLDSLNKNISVSALSGKTAKITDNLSEELVNNLSIKDSVVSVLSSDNLVRETSDTSFDTLKDLVIYIYANYSETEHYYDAVKAMMVVYPELKFVYQDYIQSAALISGY